MSAPERSQWKSHFIFSSNILNKIPDVRSDLENIESKIKDTLTRLPDLDSEALDSADILAPAAVPSADVVKMLMKLAARPMARGGRALGTQPGVRLLPLETFIWGSAANPPQPRTRPDHTLIWVTDGRLNLDYPGMNFVMSPGDLRVVLAGTAFCALPARNARGHVALISPSLTLYADPPFPTIDLAAHVGFHSQQFLSTLTDLAERSRLSDTAALAGSMNLLTQQMSRLGAPRAPTLRTEMPRVDKLLAERFLALAAHRLSACDLVADLAQELGTTAAHLDRSCIAARGRRAIELIYQLRLDKAVTLLRETQVPPAQIATQLGYTSHGHFTRAFVAATGRTPEVFRAQKLSSS